jgi:lipopolysaccharide transport system permease protein
MVDRAGGVSDLFARIWRHRQLLLELIRRDVTDRHAGHLLGAGWSVAHPLILTGVYLFLFAVVVPLRMGGTATSDYVIYVLSGLIPWLAAQDAFLRGVVALSGNANLVKQVIFPIELLPIKGTLSALLPPAVMSVATAIFVLIARGSLPWTLGFLPVLWLFQVLGTWGICIALSAAGAYFRDLREVVQVFCLVNLYLMPVFYPPSALPAGFQFIPYINPFSYGVWCHQDAWSGQLAHPYAWAIFPAMSGLALIGGYRLFRKAKPFFGNVL